MMDALDHLIREFERIVPLWEKFSYRDKRRVLLNALRMAQILRQIEKQKKKEK
jgi:hypothetical protein